MIQLNQQGCATATPSEVSAGGAETWLRAAFAQPMMKASGEQYFHASRRRPEYDRQSTTSTSLRGLSNCSSRSGRADFYCTGMLCCGVLRT